MAGDYCLDTNIAIALLNGRETVIRKIADADRVALPIPVVGELLYGARNSRMKDANLKRFKSFIDDCELIQPDLAVGEVYAEMKLFLKQKGTPIPENDIWIAACASRTNLVLVTDDKHFSNLPMLELENWLS